MLFEKGEKEKPSISKKEEFPNSEQTGKAQPAKDGPSQAKAFENRALPKNFVFLLLGIAIASEVTGATTLKLSCGFGVFPFNIVTVAAYGISISLLIVILKYLPLGLTYGIWGGLGSAATMIVGVLLWGDPFTPLMAVALVVIVAGTYLLNAGTDEIEARRKP